MKCLTLLKIRVTQHLGSFYLGQHGKNIPDSPCLYSIQLTLQWSLCLNITYFPRMPGEVFTINMRPKGEGRGN